MSRRQLTGYVMKRPVAIPGEVFKKRPKETCPQREVHDACLASCTRCTGCAFDPHAYADRTANVDSECVDDRHVGLLGNTKRSVDGRRSRQDRLKKASARSHRWAVWCDASGRSAGRESLARKADAREHPRMENPSATCMKRRLSEILVFPSVPVTCDIRLAQLTNHEAPRRENSWPPRARRAWGKRQGVQGRGRAQG